MLIEITLALILGLLAGTITGLFPGIHINLIATILTSSLTLTQTIPVIALISIKPQLEIPPFPKAASIVPEPKLIKSVKTIHLFFIHRI